MCVDVSVCICIENQIEMQESNSTIFVIGTEEGVLDLVAPSRATGACEKLLSNFN